MYKKFKITLINHSASEVLLKDDDSKFYQCEIALNVNIRNYIIRDCESTLSS